MSKKFPIYKELDLYRINKEVLNEWERNETFGTSLTLRQNSPTFVFYEGPPSANGMPGIHHVISRTIKDVICRYKTQQGYLVNRKAGWDTHGLPVELSVEKSLSITKEDIGKKISIADYNKECRKDVMKYTDIWEELTKIMGYWLNLNDPYITYKSKYIETLWWMLKQLYNKGLLYKGYTIQPYSPGAGTGLSTHELNQPGCYKDVKDTACVAQFKIIKNEKSQDLYINKESEIFFLAWTTTPWTLPSNTALAVGNKIEYVQIKTYNQYTYQPITVILAKNLYRNFFPEKNENLDFEAYNPGDKNIPYKVLNNFTGSELEGIEYEQLIPWVKPDGDAFRVITGDFVTTEDGTGIVHIAPTFGSDDDRVAKISGIVPILLTDKDGKKQPMVDKLGKFYLMEDLSPKFIENFVNTHQYKEYSGRFVKNEYDSNLLNSDQSLDIDICVMLKKENKAFKVEKHIHNYPHCWRTDKPVLYYPLDSWFIRTTALRDRMLELNETINWKPESTGTGRFAKWLENLVDWNLSRSRFWGTPLPIWRSEDGKYEKCIGSIKELINEINKSIEAGIMKNNPYQNFKIGDISDDNYENIDLHRPFVDQIILVSDIGTPLFREPDLIDVWFDSGAMPYAQFHYPFENKDSIDNGDLFPADFIAEGVDQTRGWFFTLHALATMISDSVAFKNIISNGLVLDKSGNKMSKRLGNAVEPFIVIEEFGSDALRWYMMTNSQPWDNLKFDKAGVDEVKRKFFGTLYNTYSFFALYANVDGFDCSQPQIPIFERCEIDQWIISLLNTLIKEVTSAYENYEITRAGRLIQNFVSENLSNWYVRLNRKRFWGGTFDNDKLSAYQTLHQCLLTVASLAAPIAPFFMDRLFSDLNIYNKESFKSVHHDIMPKHTEEYINSELELQMEYAQKISSMVLSLRRKIAIKVRQPLQKIMLPILDENFKQQIDAVKNLILTEVNVKELQYVTDDSGILTKKIKPNFKTLGPKYGKIMKEIAATINNFSADDIRKLENEKSIYIRKEDQNIEISLEDVEITSEDIPGMLASNEGKLTVALDVTITEDLKEEGIARELINKIQNLRKDSGLDVVDKIRLKITRHNATNSAIEKHKEYICSQTLTSELLLVDKIDNGLEIEFDENISIFIAIEKI
ncbi:MAG: isoleucine--tRNA ligase [Marinilabiliaceae bacterium]|nr:isoleucine--tRNA ligase [Marinilabiliaceae bacterium]